jgi:hypothetical protein
MINCRECNEECAESAEVCPHCGVRLPNAFHHEMEQSKKIRDGVYGEIAFVPAAAAAASAAICAIVIGAIFYTPGIGCGVSFLVAIVIFAGVLWASDEHNLGTRASGVIFISVAVTLGAAVAGWEGAAVGAVIGLGPAMLEIDFFGRWMDQQVAAALDKESHTDESDQA